MGKLPANAVRRSRSSFTCPTVLVDEVGHALHLGLPHAARCEGGRVEQNAGQPVRAVARTPGFVGRDADQMQQVLDARDVDAKLPAKRRCHFGTDDAGVLI